jgi:hypothetical protein
MVGSVLDLDLDVATACLRLDQQWVGTPVQVDEGLGVQPGDSGEGIGAVACMAETLRHRVGGHRASLDGGRRRRRKEWLREWQSGERGRLLYTYPSKSG